MLDTRIERKKECYELDVNSLDKYELDFLSRIWTVNGNQAFDPICARVKVKLRNGFPTTAGVLMGLNYSYRIDPSRRIT